MVENSLAFQRWDGDQSVASPEGTDEVGRLRRPFGTSPHGCAFPALKRRAILICPSGTEIIQGDWIWENAGYDPGANPPWHSYKGQRRFVMLLGDNHTEFFRFPLNIAVGAPVSPTNPYW